LTRLRAARKRTLLLSNAPRRNEAARAAMRAMGITDDLYDDILTSGEATHEALRDPPDAWWDQLGPRLYHLGPERDRNVFAGLDLTPVRTPAEATFVLNTGPDDTRSPHDVAEFEDVLEDCHSARLPMVCANLDLAVVRGGERVICAGALAARYLELGGDVREVGKPHPGIYRAVLDRLGVTPARVLAVGDALRTDIAGAAAAGLNSCWVLGGIHGEALGHDPARASAVAFEAGFYPIASIMGFAW
jgi:HAD superfamily hydrolase (TIGR01459 family)